MKLFQRICIALFPAVIYVMFPNFGFSQQATIDQSQQYKEAGIMMEPEIFLEVILNNNAPNKCSPSKQAPSWRGVLIQAPNKVSFNRSVRIGPNKTFAAIPICGWFMLDLHISKEPSGTQLFAKNIKTDEIYSGKIVEYKKRDFVEPQPNLSPLTEDDVKGMASGSYFNPNLADFVKLPEEPGVYEVYVEVDGNRSNTVTIEIVEEPDEEEVK